MRLKKGFPQFLLSVYVCLFVCLFVRHRSTDFIVQHRSHLDTYMNTSSFPAACLRLEQKEHS